MLFDLILYEKKELANIAFELLFKSFCSKEWLF